MVPPWTMDESSDPGMAHSQEKSWHWAGLCVLGATCRQQTPLLSPLNTALIWAGDSAHKIPLPHDYMSSNRALSHTQGKKTEESKNIHRSTV